MMEFKGRYITRNGKLVAVHLNPAATPGNRVERYLGHTIEEATVTKTGNKLCVVAVKVCWNENGECVWLQGSMEKEKDYDLMEGCAGDRFARERGLVVVGCKECNTTDGAS